MLGEILKKRNLVDDRTFIEGKKKTFSLNSSRGGHPEVYSHPPGSPDHRGRDCKNFCWSSRQIFRRGQGSGKNQKKERPNVWKLPGTVTDTLGAALAGNKSHPILKFDTHSFQNCKRLNPGFRVKKKRLGFSLREKSFPLSRVNKKLRFKEALGEREKNLSTNLCALDSGGVILN